MKQNLLIALMVTCYASISNAAGESPQTRIVQLEGMSDIDSLMLSPDGNKIALTDERRFKVLDANTFEELYSLPLNEKIIYAWHPDSVRIAIVQELSDTGSEESPDTDDEESPDTDDEESPDTDDEEYSVNSRVRLFNIAQQQQIGEKIFINTTPYCIKWSPTGDTLAIGGSQDKSLVRYASTTEGILWLHNFETGQSRHLTHAGLILDCAWSPDSHHLATTAEGDVLFLADRSELELLRMPDSTPKLKLWHIKEQEITDIQIPLDSDYTQKDMTQCSWSDDGKYLAALTKDQIICIWHDPLTQPGIRTFKEKKLYDIKRFNWIGSLLAIYNCKTLWLYDPLNTKRQRLPIREDGGERDDQDIDEQLDDLDFYSIDYSPTGRLVAGADDGHVASISDRRFPLALVDYKKQIITPAHIVHRALTGRFPSHLHRTMPPTPPAPTAKADKKYRRGEE